MLPFIAALAAFLPLAMPAAQGNSLRLYSIPTSEEVRVATMAARDEGYNPENEGTFLDEISTPDGRQPHPGYKTIGLYSDGALVHTYSIRIQTGDVVDPRTCQLFEYPDLLRFKQKLMNSFGTDPVPPARIAEEIGCTKVDVLHAPPRQKSRPGL